MAHHTRLGFVGLGLMGQPMVARLIDAGHEVIVYNRSRWKCAPFEERGVAAVESLQELASKSDVIITMLATSAAVETTVLGSDGILAAAHPGLMLIDMSSTAPKTSVDLAVACAGLGVAMIDAPVAGTVRAATDGSLVIMVGGEQAAYLDATKILSSLGKHVFHVGPNGAGCQMKLVVNVLLSLTSQALAEALAFGAAQGLDLRRMHEVLVTTPSSSGIVVRKGQAMIDHDFTPAAPLRLLHKDLGQALAVAQDLGIPMPATATAHSLYAAGVALGHAEQDFAAIFAVMEHLVGLDRSLPRPAIQDGTSCPDALPFKLDLGRS